MRRLKSVLPRYYTGDPLTDSLQMAADHMAVDVSSVENELTLETSEVYLRTEEENVGCSSGSSKAERANSVRARYRLVNSSISIADLQGVVNQSLYGGKIEVAQPMGNPTQLNIIFNERGIPKDYDDLMEKLTASLPCNVYVVPVYVYTTHKQLVGRVSHEQLSQYSHKYIREEIDV